MPFLSDINLSSVILSPTRSERNVITPLADVVPLTIKGINGQSARYLCLLDSLGIDLFAFNANGSFQLYGHTLTSEGNPSSPYQVSLAQAGGWLLIEDSGAATAAGFYGATALSGVAKVRTISTSDLPTIAHSSLSGLTSGDDHAQYAKLSSTAGSRNVFTCSEYDATTVTIDACETSDTGGYALKCRTNAGTTVVSVGDYYGTGWAQVSANFYVTGTLYFGAGPTPDAGSGYIRATRVGAANAGHLVMDPTSTNAGGYITTAAGASGAGGNIDTSNDGGSITTNGIGSIGLGASTNRTTLAGSASTVTCTLPAITGTLASLAGTQTFTGAKTFTNATCLLRNSGNTASATLATTASTSRTMTFPDLTATVLVASSTSTTASQICMATTTAGGVAFATMSGDATIASGGALTIANNAVTLAKMATMATASLLGRDTAGTGNVEVLSASTTKTLLSLNNVENTALSTWAGTANITTLGTISTGTWSGTAIGVSYGGTGATTAATARSNLGLAIGSDVQAYDADLASIAGSTVAQGALIVGSSTPAWTTLSAGTNGYYLMSQGTGADLTWQRLPAATVTIWTGSTGAATWASQPAAETEAFNSPTQWKFLVSTINRTQFRLVVQWSTSGNAGAKLYLKASTSSGGTYNRMETSSGTTGDNTYSSAAYSVGSWVDIDASYTNTEDIYVKVYGSGGNGATGLAVRTVLMQLR